MMKRTVIGKENKKRATSTRRSGCKHGMSGNTVRKECDLLLSKNKDLCSMIEYHNKYTNNNNIFGQRNLSDHQHVTKWQNADYSSQQEKQQGFWKGQGCRPDKSTQLIWEQSNLQTCGNIVAMKNPSNLVQPPKINERFQTTISDQSTFSSQLLLHKSSRPKPLQNQEENLNHLNSFFYSSLKDNPLDNEPKSKKFIQDFVLHDEIDHIDSLHNNIITDSHLRRLVKYS